MAESSYYTVEQVKTLAEVSVHTVHAWVEEFGDYLSPTANPGKGKMKKFSREDMGVVLLIAQLKADGQHYADIHAALQSGQRAPIPEASPDELKTLIATDDRRQLATQNEALVRQVDELRREIAILQATKEENIALKKEIEMLREQGGQDEIRRLERLIGRLEYEIESLRKSGE